MRNLHYFLFITLRIFDYIIQAASKPHQGDRIDRFHVVYVGRSFLLVHVTSSRSFVVESEKESVYVYLNSFEDVFVDGSKGDV